MEDAQVDLLYLELPRLNAIEEINHRMRNSKMTEERIHDLLWLATGDKEYAERTSAWLSLSNN